MRGPVLGVAIKLEFLTVCLPKPNRHHHCFRHAGEVLGLEREAYACAPLDAQGFYTEHGEFLDRRSAYAIARDNGQLINGERSDEMLFSEDLW